MISVLVVDDQALIRSAVRDLLDGDPEVMVIAEAVNGLQAAQLAEELHPDVVVMDIRMPVMDGIESTAAICSRLELASTRVLILTTFDEDEYLVAALRAGASGFIGKGADPDDILRAIYTVHAGEALLSPAATWALITRFILPPSVATALPDTAKRLFDQITEREQEVLMMVARGRTNAQIAAELFISQHTVKTHVNRVMTKLRAHDRAQLVVIAYEAGVLTPRFD